MTVMHTRFLAVLAAVLALTPFTALAQDQQPAGDQTYGRGDPVVPSGENQGASLEASGLSQPEGRGDPQITGPGPSNTAPAAPPEVEQDFGRSSPMPVESNR
jgi:hypothetical protein